MKKCLCSLGLFVFLFFLSFNSANALSFAEALEQSDKKPMIVIIYAEWADSAGACLEKFNALEKKFGNKFNYVELNIASPDTKAFNDKYHIYPQLPYIMMFKDNGKLSRYIQKNCVNNESCLHQRIEQFSY